MTAMTYKQNSRVNCGCKLRTTCTSISALGVQGTICLQVLLDYISHHLWSLIMLDGNLKSNITWRTKHFQMTICILLWFHKISSSNTIKITFVTCFLKMQRIQVGVSLSIQTERVQKANCKWSWPMELAEHSTHSLSNTTKEHQPKY